MRIQVGMPYSQIVWTDRDSTKGMQKLEKLLTVSIKKFVTATKTEIQKTYLLGPDGKFRTGLLDRVKMMGPTIGLPIEQIEVESSKNTESMWELAGKKIGLWDYQQDAVGQLASHNMGLVSVATGGGKTHIAAGIIAKQALSTLFLVNTKDLLYQTKDRFESLLGIKVGVIGDSEFDARMITIGTIQTLHRRMSEGQLQNIKDKFDMIIVDECHHVPAQTFFAVTGYFNCGIIYGLSATPTRKDGADLMIEAGVGPIRVDVSSSVLIKNGRLAKPVINPISITGQTSYSFAPRHMIIKKYLVENDHRNRVIAGIANKFAPKGQSVLIAVDHVKHANLIKRYIDSAIILDGSDTSSTRKKVWDDFRSKKVLIVISTLAKEGIDIQSLNHMVLGAASSDATQLVGRALRKAPDKDVVTIWDFVDWGHIRLLQNSRSRIKRYKEEPEFVVMPMYEWTLK